mmetsp:Transcript_5888/g.15178  ORF Transcript_5888/g.15178 Transcript_5888/m.15178 type:complete len:593 (+) Transcript_5888:1298-3076(+)
MSSRPLMSGRSTVTVRSKRPGRSRAGSKMSGRFVPASTTTPEVVPKPSISTRSWFSVFSRSSFPPIAAPRPRARPMASISSMNIMLGWWLRACANRSRTRAGPTPTNISMKSEPEMLKKGTSDSPAVALARSVFPVPGGPTRSAPRGIFAPRSTNFCGLRRNLTNSIISTFASLQPATSLNIILFFEFLSCRVTCALPTLKIPRDPPPDPGRPPPNILPPPSPPPSPPPIWLLENHTKPPMRRSVGRRRSSSTCQLSSDTYVTGKYSLGIMPRDSCASSICLSNASTEPMLKKYLYFAPGTGPDVLPPPAADDDVVEEVVGEIMPEAAAFAAVFDDDVIASGLTYTFTSDLFVTSRCDTCPFSSKPARNFWNEISCAELPRPDVSAHAAALSTAELKSTFCKLPFARSPSVFGSSPSPFGPDPPPPEPLPELFILASFAALPAAPPADDSFLGADDEDSLAPPLLDCCPVELGFFERDEKFSNPLCGFSLMARLASANERNASRRSDVLTAADAVAAAADKDAAVERAPCVITGFTTPKAPTLAADDDASLASARAGAAHAAPDAALVVCPSAPSALLCVVRARLMPIGINL